MGSDSRSRSRSRSRRRRIRRRRLRFATTAAAVAAVAVAVVTEVATWRAARDALPASRPGDANGRDGAAGTEIVLVLGFRSSASGRVNAMQRWRTRIALRTVSPGARLLFSGGPSGAEGVSRSEAATMADEAVRVGFPRDRILLEETSTTTWENVRNSLEFLRSADVIRVASNTFHARRARRYIAVQAPELVERLRPGRDFVWGERLPLTVSLLVYELVRARLRSR